VPPRPEPEWLAEEVFGKTVEPNVAPGLLARKGVARLLVVKARESPALRFVSQQGRGQTGSSFFTRLISQGTPAGGRACATRELGRLNDPDGPLRGDSFPLEHLAANRKQGVMPPGINCHHRASEKVGFVPFFPGPNRLRCSVIKSPVGGAQRGRGVQAV
jgi:hypothetical protein